MSKKNKVSIHMGKWDEKKSRYVTQCCPAYAHAKNWLINRDDWDGVTCKKCLFKRTDKDVYRSDGD